MRIRGKGVPATDSRPAGDFYAVIQIRPPRDLDEESRELLQDLADRHPDFKVLCVHGADDPSVSPDAAERSAAAVREQGVPVTFATFPTRHRVLRDESCQAAVRAFLAA